MEIAIIIILIALVFHVIQNDARLWQVVKELRKIRKSMEQK